MLPSPVSVAAALPATVTGLGDLIDSGRPQGAVVASCPGPSPCRRGIRRTGLDKTLGSRNLTRAGNVVLTWHATNNGNRLVGSGRYGVREIGIDPAGNRTAARTVILVIR